MTLKYLCPLFGVTPSTPSRIISKKLKRTTQYLYYHNDPEVKFPDDDKLRFARMVQRR